MQRVLVLKNDSPTYLSPTLQAPFSLLGRTTISVSRHSYFVYPVIPTTYTPFFYKTAYKTHHIYAILKLFPFLHLLFGFFVYLCRQNVIKRLSGVMRLCL